MKISKIALCFLITTSFCFASETSREVNRGGSGGGGGGDKIANNFKRGGGGEGGGGFKTSDLGGNGGGGTGGGDKIMNILKCGGEDGGGGSNIPTTNLADNSAGGKFWGEGKWGVWQNVSHSGGSEGGW